MNIFPSNNSENTVRVNIKLNKSLETSITIKERN